MEQGLVITLVPENAIVFCAVVSAFGGWVEEPFTKIPNSVLRDQRLDTYDFKILCCILSLGKRAFPSYEKLMEWVGSNTRSRISKSIKKLETLGFIVRYKLGRSVFYVTKWTSSPRELVNNPRSVLLKNSTSSPRELEPVLLKNHIKTNYKELIKREKFFIEKERNQERNEEEKSAKVKASVKLVLDKLKGMS